MIKMLLLSILALSLHVKLTNYDKWFIDEATKYIMKINKNIKKSTAFDIAYYTTVYSKAFGVDPEISLCIMKAESSFKIDADSGIAGGLLQVNYKFWSVDKERLLLDIKYSIYFGIKVIKYTLELGDKLTIAPESTQLYRYFLLYHGGVRRFFAKRLTQKERKYIKNIKACFRYFDKKYFEFVSFSRR